MSLVAFSGGLDNTGSVWFSGGSRSTSTYRSSASSPAARYLDSLFVPCRSASLVSINISQRFPTEDFRRNLPPFHPQLVLQSPLPSRQVLVLEASTVDRPRSSADIFAAPSSIDGAGSHVDSGEYHSSSNSPCLVTGESPLNSGMNKLSNSSIKRPFNSKPRRVSLWAWPFKNHESINDLVGPPNFNPMSMVFDDLFCVATVQKISGGFTGLFILRVMLYLSLVKSSLPMGSSGWSLPPSILPLLPFSSEEWFSSSYLFSLKGDDYPNSMSSFGFSFLISEDWFSTSLYVTISLLSDFVVKAISTHSSFVSNLLLSSFEELSCLCFIVVVYAFNRRGWIIPSDHCNQTV
ncbi:hypothetical protein Bca52824_092782 [Brassica carinata]|uniref:Uncharacterized protein n=1 Tax=Brassica carinata TaxID=52824 RepID=A0A8X7P6Y7_BRACI|nr:hypothetical protein Bca52824_092782 [Brassica carinata]